MVHKKDKKYRVIVVINTLCETRNTKPLYSFGSFMSLSWMSLIFGIICIEYFQLLYQKMSLTQEQITRLGKLTSLHTLQNLSVDTVLDSFEALTKIDVSHIHQSTRSWKNKMIPRPDIVQSSLTADALLACSSQKKAAHQIVLWWIIAGE
jgi:Asp-tRNA(Asn)/Glu-tRNA(Gln) amidotransferase C subunit